MDEEDNFGGDVLPSQIEEDHKDIQIHEEASPQWNSSRNIKTDDNSMNDEDEDEDDDLYGGVAVTVKSTSNSGDTSTNEPKGEEENKKDDEDEEDDEIAIVMNDAKATVKPTLRFLGGAHKYIRPGASGIGSPSLHVSRKGNQMSDALEDIVLPGGKRHMFDIEIDELEEKPWRKPGVDISDYFNYGFDEYSWRMYCGKQQQIRRELVQQKLSGGAFLNPPSQPDQNDPSQSVPSTSKASLPDESDPNRGTSHPPTPGDWSGSSGSGGMPPRGGNDFFPRGPPMGGPSMGGPPMGGPPMGGPPPGWHPMMGPPRGGFRGPPPPWMGHPQGLNDGSNQSGRQEEKLDDGRDRSDRGGRQRGSRGRSREDNKNEGDEGSNRERSRVRDKDRSRSRSKGRGDGNRERGREDRSSRDPSRGRDRESSRKRQRDGDDRGSRRR